MNERLIKFLAWHKPTQKLFPVYGFNDHHVYENSLDGIHTSETLPAKREDCILLQFAGMYDMKGAEVYEGQIIQTVVVDHTEKTGRAVYYNEIAFRDGCFGMMGEIDRDKHLSFAEVDLNDAEVIGNIFQNHELVERLVIDLDGTYYEKRFSHIPDVVGIQSGNLTNWFDYESAFIAMQKADNFIESSMKATDWTFIRNEYFNTGMSVKEAFQDMFYE